MKKERKTTINILVIERFTEKEYLKDSAKYLEENHLFIEQLYNEGEISLCWSRSDKDCNVLMMETDSLAKAKELLKSSPLYKKKIITYTILPLEDYQFDKSFSATKNNFVLIYASSQARELGPDELKEILEIARKRNPNLHVTGMLVYHDGSFLQVLEGNRKKVENLFNKIKTDSRHNRVAKITSYYTAERLFSDWSMGFADVTKEQLESIKCLNDFFSNGNSLANIQEEQAKNILSAFKEGKWRQRIS